MTRKPETQGEEWIAQSHAKVDAWKPIILIGCILFAYLSVKMGLVK